MNQKLIIILLTAIIVLAAFLRLWGLGSTPPSPDWDEASFAYNAYSVLHTGRDEYGKFLPPVIKSFGDYKPALYMYAAVPSIAVFGLNTFAVRLPSALFGVLTVLATYFLVEELFKRKDLALLSAFFLAISPWHIQFSRVAFESNVGLALNIFGALFFLKGLKKPWLLLLSFASFALCLYAYQSEKIFTPLLALVLLVIYWRSFWFISKKYLVSAFVVGILLSVPMLYFLAANGQALSRAESVSIFSVDTFLSVHANQNLLAAKKSHNLLGEVIFNRRVVYAKEAMQGYFAHFDLNWLFITGDINRHHAPNMGLLYLWDLPFLFIGIYSLLFGKYQKRTRWLIFSWFLIAPIPASVTSGVPHAVRTLNFLPTFQIFTAIGVLSTYFFLKDYKKSDKKYFVGKTALTVLLLVFGIGNFGYYLDQYFVQQNYFNSEDWQYGYEQLVPTVQSLQNKYKKIVVSNEAPLDQSYIFFLVYLKYPPVLYQKRSSLNATDFDSSHDFANFEFRKINWQTELKDSSILYVGGAKEFPPGIKHLKTVNFLDGTPAMEIVQG